MTKKIIGALLALALIAGAAWAGTAWHAGKKVQVQIESDLKMLFTDIHPVIMVVEQKHERGLFSSRGHVVIGLDPNCMAQGPDPEAAQFFDGMRVRYDYSVDHGPRLTGLGWGIVKGSVEFDGDIKEMLEQFEIPSTLFTHRTRAAFDGNYYSDVEMPAWESKMPDGSSIKSLGLKGTVESGSGMPRRMRMDLQGQGMEVLNAQGARAFVIEPLQFKADLNYVKPQLALGSMDFSIAGLSASSPFGGPPMFEIKGLEIHTLTQQGADELLDIDIGLKAREGMGMSFSFKNARYEFAFKRLHADTLFKLDKLLNGSCIQADPAEAEKNTQAAGKLAAKLLSYNPEIELKALGAETNMGVFNFSGRVVTRDIKEEDLVGFNPETLKSKIVVEGKAEVPAALLQSDPRMESLLLDGLLTLEGTSVKTAFNFTGGALTLNGKPADPKALFGPPPQPEEPAPAVTPPPKSGAGARR